MKRLTQIAALVSVLFLGSCVMYSDKDEPVTPQVDVTDLVYFGVIEPVFRVTEMADFFDRYQEIRADREASLALAQEYFGDYFYSNNLYYEQFRVVPYWGTIELTETEDLYNVSSPYNRWGAEIDRKVTALGERRYSIVCKASRENDYPMTYELLATVSCADGTTMKVESLEMTLVEDSEEGYLNVSVTQGADGSLTIPICKVGNCSHYPDSGALLFNVTGDEMDLFQVTFHPGKYEIVSGSGTVTVTTEQMI